MMGTRWLLSGLIALAAAGAASAAPQAPVPDPDGSAGEESRDLTALSLDELLDVRIPRVYAASRYERGYLDLGYDGALGGGADLSAHLYYDRYDYRGNDLYAGPPENINRDPATGAWVGLDDRLTFPVGDRQVLTCGTEMQVDLRQDQSNYDVDPYVSRLDSRKWSHLWAAYVQDEATLWKEWSLVAGVRYDRYETFGSTINPRTTTRANACSHRGLGVEVGLPGPPARAALARWRLATPSDRSSPLGLGGEPFFHERSRSCPSSQNRFCKGLQRYDSLGASEEGRVIGVGGRCGRHRLGCLT